MLVRRFFRWDFVYLVFIEFLFGIFCLFSLMFDKNDVFDKEVNGNVDLKVY